MAFSSFFLYSVSIGFLCFLIIWVYDWMQDSDHQMSDTEWREKLIDLVLIFTPGVNFIAIPLLILVIAEKGFLYVHLHKKTWFRQMKKWSLL